MKIWHIILMWLISHFLLGAFTLSPHIMSAIYFIINDLFMIAFFVIILHTEHREQIRNLYFAGLYYSVAMLFDNTLLYLGIGNVSKWYYETILLIFTLIGFTYGNVINKLRFKVLRDYLGFLFCIPARK